MKFFAAVSVFALSTPVFLTKAYTVRYDEFYDNNLASLNSVACSNGQYGLIPYGYNTFGDIPTYPILGGAPQIQGWNSPNCGTCWSLTYTGPHGAPSSVTFTAINSGDQGGFVMSFAGFDLLTNGNALRFGEVEVTASPLPESACGITF